MEEAVAIAPDLISMTHPAEPTPQTYSIVCLECRSGYLYAEVVQMAEPPQRCWLRPLWLKLMEETGSEDPNSVRCVDTGASLYDLHGSPDLLWSQADVRVALDTEILPLLMAFPATEESTRLAHLRQPSPIAKQQLHYFLRQLWQHQTPSTDRSQHGG